jgi:hypothetical protein
MGKFLIKIKQYLFRKGIKETISYGLFRINEWRLRKKLGIIDFRAQALSDFGKFDKTYNRYGSTHLSKLKKNFKLLDIKPNWDVFIDFEAGKRDCRAICSSVSL